MLNLKDYVLNHESNIINVKSDVFDNPSTQEYYKLKKAVQYYFSHDLLPELSKSVVTRRLAAELNSSIRNNRIQAGFSLSVEMYDDEKFTTNNYSHIYGKDMNLSEILQRGEQ
jgi:hypothetical protein